ncbi:MAG: hypothetical protein IT337_17390 [Thermomicrobiales bacterium]|nr:hypothetical protein [Thermomicrobiales bacterium]
MRTWHIRFIIPGSRRWLLAALVLTLLPVLAPVTAQAAPAGGETWTVRFTNQAALHFDPALSEHPQLAPDLFTATNAELLDTSIHELALVLGIAVSAPVDIWITAGAGGADPSAPAITLDPADHSLLVDGVILTALTPVEADNAFSSAIARRLAIEATNGQLAPAFTEGFTLYAREPLTPVLSRYAALLQNANAQGGLLSWADLHRTVTGEMASTDLAVAEQYAVTAFLIDHYGISAYRAFLNASATTTDWRMALQTGYRLPANEIESAWRDDLSRWTNSGWKTNIIAGFDLDPARALLERGNYAAAKAMLERSQRLFSEIGDEVSLQTVSTLLTQCDVGLQAEALMTQTEDALRQFNYAGAGDLLTQAEAQYARLPPDQRPTAVLTAYRDLTNRGLTAIAQLDNANRLAGSWTEFPRARDDALAAGATFAQLGDADRLEATTLVLDRIDERQRRLVLLLGGLAVISLIWLLLWRKHGVNQTMRWPERLRPVVPATSDRSE